MWLTGIFYYNGGVGVILKWGVNEYLCSLFNTGLKTVLKKVSFKRAKYTITSNKNSINS